MPLLKNSDGAVILYVAKQGAMPTVEEINERLGKSTTEVVDQGLGKVVQSGEIRKYVARLYELEALFAEARELGMKMESPVPGWAGSQPVSTLSYLAAKHGLFPNGMPSIRMVGFDNPKPAEHTPLFKSVPGGLYVLALDVYDEYERATVRLPDDSRWVRVDRDAQAASPTASPEASGAPTSPKPTAAEEPAEKFVEFLCSSCKARLRIKVSLAEKRLRCPKCKEIVAAPHGALISAR